MTDTISSILAGGAFTRQQADALRLLLRTAGRYVGQGTTAQRPTLTSADAGATYFDTTLAPDGQPVWWTGSDWVDSAGAVT